MKSSLASTPRSRENAAPGTSLASTNNRIASTSSTPRSTRWVSRSMVIAGCAPRVSTTPTITIAIAIVMLIVSNRRATSAHSTTISNRKAIPNTGADRDSINPAISARPSYIPNGEPTMCFAADALPPRIPEDRVIPALAGGAAAERLTLEGADGTPFLAAFAECPDPVGGPAVIILPDVRGLYSFYVDLAERFVSAGYHALAIDYFGRTAGVQERDDEFDCMPHVMQTTPAQGAGRHRRRPRCAGRAHRRDEFSSRWDSASGARNLTWPAPTRTSAWMPSSRSTECSVRSAQVSTPRTSRRRCATPTRS